MYIVHVHVKYTQNIPIIIQYTCTCHILHVGSVAVTLEQTKHKEKESDLNSEKRSLKVEIKELELAHQETVKALKKVNIMLLYIMCIK